MKLAEFAAAHAVTLGLVAIWAPALMNTTPAIASTIAYWRFENGVPNTGATGAASILDSSGNALHGSPVGGPVYRSNVPANPVPGTGATNSVSLDFNGTTQRVFVPDDPRLQLTQSLTVEAFVNIRSIVGANFGRYIVFRGDDRANLDPFALYILNQDPGANVVGFLIYDAAGTVEHLDVPLPGFDQWFHVAGTLDDASGLMSLYINGALAASAHTSVRPFGALDPAMSPGVGIASVQSDTYDQHLDGHVDEVRISDRALGPGEFLVPEPRALSAVILIAGLIRPHRLR